MQIYLAKPGSQKEGPFTLEDINQDLAAGKYTHNDYWAWYDGLPQWLPLYEIPGVAPMEDDTPLPKPRPAAPKSVQAAAVTPARAAARSATLKATAPAPIAPQKAETPTQAADEVSPVPKVAAPQPGNQRVQPGRS